MALNTSGLNKGRNTRTKGTGGSENVCVEFKAVEVENAKQGTPEKDVLVAYLLHDAYGLKAEFDANGHPKTEIRVVMKKREVKAGSNPPLSIFDLPRKRGMHQPMKPGGHVVLEGSYLEEKTGIVRAGWLSITVRDLNEGLETTLVDLPISVDRERFDEKDGVKKYRQARFVASTSDAKAINSFDDFRATAIEQLTQDVENGVGRPSIWLRILDTNLPKDGGPLNGGTTRISLGWDSEAQRRLTAEESVDRWLADDRNAQWVSNLQLAGTKDAEGYVIETIPFYQYFTGSNSLPSANTKFHRDDYDNFRIPREVVTGGEDGGPRTVEFERHSKSGDYMFEHGYAIGSMAIRRQEANAEAPWFGTKAFRQNRFGPIFREGELLTPNLPAHVRTYFTERATKLGQFMAELTNTNRATNSAAPAEAQQGGDDYDDGFQEPDQAGGLSPR